LHDSDKYEELQKLVPSFAWITFTNVTCIY
jgi:hypothetical protein